MPSVAQAPLMNSVSFMLKEKSVEPVAPAFTAVNGRASPPSPPRRTNGVNGTIGANGMNGDSTHPRPLSNQRPEENQERRATSSRREEWTSPPGTVENGLSSGRHSASPPNGERTSPGSPGKRKRSSSPEDVSSAESTPEAPSYQARRRLDSYVTESRDDSPPHSQTQTSRMEHSQQRPFAPLDRAEPDRNWPPQDSKEFVRGTFEPQQRESHRLEPSQENIDGQRMTGIMDPQHYSERSSTAEITRAGVQVDPKKRKRVFANRTKTGCGTCRRRKKKCDEAKPECNNCNRGGFVCEGYANKIPWPKNGVSKPHVPLQAKDRFPMDSAQLYHSHGQTQSQPQSRDGYSEPNKQVASDGARTRPIVIEEQERQGSRNGWAGIWGEPPRPSYPPEHPPPSEYGRPPPNDHQTDHSSQTPAPLRQPKPRIYHHSQETMNPYGSKNPSVSGHLLQHQTQPNQNPTHSGPSSGALRTSNPPPPHYAQQPQPPKPQKTEKEKMLSGEPYFPFDNTLVEEREQCRNALFRFNSSVKGNPSLGISREERDRTLRTIIEAPWARAPRTPDPTPGRLGTSVFVDTPFTCDYGYNIRLGDHVVISPHCRLMDSCMISIGARTMLGENVTLQTKTVNTDPRKRQGSRGMVYAAGITIEEDVFIGCDVTILPGVKVGKGSTIAAGSVVTRVSF
ncbi:hypothetical protein BCR34DRAFT_588314 [Clohesyomyces aquaticus]|uniref:Zn(2)-C6 fungal-type domain-containing protein n=1 Tax=Clohesyomyces aquaticus TaxID=1231657 RepID=A0A1Y1ZKU3_9PLEO|nr:hypothetical protein BCR34DRAFT_588314 [Clohesyomyces aquaticus]